MAANPISTLARIGEQPTNGQSGRKSLKRSCRSRSRPKSSAKVRHARRQVVRLARAYVGVSVTLSAGLNAYASVSHCPDGLGVAAGAVEAHLSWLAMRRGCRPLIGV